MGGENHRGPDRHGLGGGRHRAAPPAGSADSKHGLAILQALNIHKGRAIILFYSSLLCVILGYFISLYYGTIGMFIGTAISLFIGQVLMINRYYARTAGLDMRRFFRRTYGPCCCPPPS